MAFPGSFTIIHDPVFFRAHSQFCNAYQTTKKWDGIPWDGTPGRKQEFTTVQEEDTEDRFVSIGNLTFTHL